MKWKLLDRLLRGRRQANNNDAGRMLLASPSTMFGPALVYDTEDEAGRPVRVLSVNGGHESAVYLDGDPSELVFPYTRLFDNAFRPGCSIQRALVIGCGAYSYPKHLICTYPDLHVDAIEIDPAMEGIAREFFELDMLEDKYAAESSGRLRLICTDGRAFLEDRQSWDTGDGDCCPTGARGTAIPVPGVPAGSRRYDLIVCDCFAGKTPVIELASVEAACLVHELLTPQGIYCTNVVASRNGPNSRLLRRQANTLLQVFEHVWILAAGDRTARDIDNHLVFASDFGSCPRGAQETFGFPEAGIICDADAKPDVDPK